MVFWNVDCSTAKHEGCHWYQVEQPQTFAWEWTGDAVFRCAGDLSDLGFDQLADLRIGVGAAHESITATAEFTDRHPDALWVTATEIQGLTEIPLQ